MQAPPAIKFELNPRFAYSAKEIDSNTVQFIDEDHVVFPIGRHIWRYNINTKEMKFLTRRGHQGSLIMAVSASRKKLAICESVSRGSKKAQITLIDLTTSPEPTVCWKFTHFYRGEVMSCDFSSDSKVICVYVKFPPGEIKVNSKATSAVGVWKTDTRRLLAVRELATDVQQVTINPSDNYLLCLSGNTYLRYLKCAGSNMDEVPLLKRLKERSYDFQSHVWVTPQTLAVVIDHQGVCIFQKSILKQTINHIQGMVGNKNKILSIGSYKDGFMIGMSDGLVVMYRAERSGGYQQYVPWKTFDSTREAHVTSLCASPSQHIIGCIVKDVGFLTLDLAAAVTVHGGIDGGSAENLFTESITPCGTIVAMDVNEQSELLVTCNTDNSIRLWKDLKTSKVVTAAYISHYCEELPLAVSVSPDGFRVLVAFTGALRESHRIPLPTQAQATRHTPVILKYSNMGSKFVLAFNTTILTYNSVTFCLLQHIPDNKDVITCVAWSNNDDVIASCNAEGAVYAWDLRNLKRIEDYVDKSCKKLHHLILDWGPQWEFKRNLGVLSAKNATNNSKLNSMLINSLPYHQEKTDDSVSSSSSSSRTNKKNTASGSNPNGYTNGVMMVVGDGREGFKMRHISDNSVVRDVYLINDTNSSDKGKGKGKGGSGGKNGSNGSSGTSIDNNLDKANRLRITIMRLDKTRNVLICGTKSGMILLYRYPFLYTDSDSHCHAQCYAKYSIHDGPILFLSVMEESGVVVSAGQDGNLFVMDLGFMDDQNNFIIRTRSYKKVKGTGANDDDHAYIGPGGTNKISFVEQVYTGDRDLVLVQHSKYTDTLKSARVHEMELKKIASTTEFKLKQTKEQYSDDLRKLREDMERLIEKKKTEVEEQKTLLKEARSKRTRERKESGNLISAKVFEVREEYEAKLYDQFRVLDLKKKELEIEKEEREKDERSFKEEKTELLRLHEEEIDRLNDARELKVTEMRQNQQAIIEEYETAISQMMDEHDIQVLELKRKQEEEVGKYRESTASAFAERSAYKTKYDSSLHEMTSLRIDSGKADEKLAAKTSQTRLLQKQLKVFKKKTREKEHKLSRRQHVLSDVRKDNAALQNFITVLEHRIAELEQREAPAHNFLQELKRQIEKMNEELFGMKQEQLLVSQFASKKAGQNTRLTKSCTNLQHELSRMDRQWQAAVKELRHIVEHTPVPEWERSLRNFYVEYVGTSNQKKKGSEKETTNQDKVYMALERQRRHLENSTSTLKNALKTAHKRRRFEADKYIARNTLFLAEVNELREANRRLEQKCKKYMSLALGKGYTPSQLTDSATSKGDESGSAQGVRGSIECRRNEEKVSSYAESTNINGNSDGGLGAAGFVDSGRLHSAASQRSISSAGSSRFSRSGTSHGSNRSSRANSRPTTSSGGRKNFTSTRSDGINDGALSSDSSDSNAAVYAEILGERRGTGVNRPGSGKTKRLGNIRHIGSSGSGGSGRLYKGTTRPLSAVSRLEQKLNNAMTELEQASAKVSQQKLEISHLQEGVSVALKMANSSSIRQTSIAPTRMSSSASTPALFTQKRTNAGMPYARKRRQIPRPTSSSSTASHKNRLKPLK